MNYLSQAHLITKYDISRSTANRVCNYMRTNARYAKYVRVVGNMYRYGEEAFVRASNERRTNGA